jgi:valyl-tRNA synthetase
MSKKKKVQNRKSMKKEKKVIKSSPSKKVVAQQKKLPPRKKSSPAKKKKNSPPQQKGKMLKKILKFLKPKKKVAEPKKTIRKKKLTRQPKARPFMVKKAPKVLKPTKSVEKKKEIPEGEIPKTYDPSIVEDTLYRIWLDKKMFTPKETKNKKRFVIPMPPPNVTNMLHLGHALTIAIEDLMIRYHRMLQEEVLYIPGTDHAGIATQVVVEKHLAEEGKTKESLGREQFIEEIWKWKEKYHQIITDQIKKMGTSCDWDRERFTLDKGLSRAVKKVFIDLYQEGLIYKGDYLVNWCPRCQTVLSDLEVNYQEEPGHLWFIRYFVKAADKSVVVATTRPETMLGDTGVAVHPDDKRYKELVGKTLILPILNREIPIVADEAVDMDFGSGAVKVTPAHDLTDFDIGKRHNLQVISVIGKDGKMSKAAGKFCGLSTEQARENIVEYLNNIGNLEETREHIHNVGYCSRCNTKVEPYLSSQWFVKMKPLAEETLTLLQKEKLTFVPERFEKVFIEWLHSVHDWCISRQLWWGHQIPAYTCKKCHKLYVAEEAPEKCSCKSKEFIQESDVLDTWFSSALWPFSILGWPLKTDDLKKYYPADVLETGYDILFFWVIRMVFMGVHFMKKLPFSTVYLHGLIRDEQGKKMSKSLGNGVNPIEVIQQYGADALRLTLTIGNTPGNDLRFSLSKVEGNRNFVNKLWNASRFILLNVKQKKRYKDLQQEMKGKFKRLPASSQWILTRTNQVIRQVTDDLNQYRFGDAGSLLYDFTWGEFCDWYIEIAKINITPTIQDVLQYCMLTILKLWHPFIPFVTEKIWSFFEQKEMLLEADWPTAQKEFINEENVNEMQIIFDIIRSIRNMRAEKQIDPHLKIDAVLIAHEQIKTIRAQEEIIKILSKINKLKIVQDGAALKDALHSLVEKVEIYLPFAGMIDKEKEKQKIKNEIVKKEQFVATMKARLQNKDFLQKAKKDVIKMEKERLAKEEEFLHGLQEQLKKIAR